MFPLGSFSLPINPCFGEFWRIPVKDTLLCPASPISWKLLLHSAFFFWGPLTFPVGRSPHPVSWKTLLLALSVVSVSWWFLPASNSRRGASELCTSVHHSASALSSPSTCAAGGGPPTTPISVLSLSLCSGPPTASALSSLFSSSILRAYWSHCRTESSHLMHLPNNFSCWNKIYHLMNPVASAYGWWGIFLD